jgi:membrane-anchored protein YejM (alkaline phosphatase superfamily)
MNKHILTECYIDTLLLKIILNAKKGCNHQYSCNKVLITMKEKFADKFAIGIIDDDKNMPSIFNEFYFIKRHNKLSIYKHKDKSHYIIKISKAVEEFILHAAQQCNISLFDYNLPNDLKNLKKITKHANSENNPDLQRLFTNIIQNDNSDFCKLYQWIEQIKANPYKETDLL